MALFVLSAKLPMSAVSFQVGQTCVCKTLPRAFLRKLSSDESTKSIVVNRIMPFRKKARRFTSCGSLSF
jgi:hypothetical protein